MAAIDFPSGPVLNQIFTTGSSVWQWDGTAWRVVRQLQPEPLASYTGINLGNASVTGGFTGGYFAQQIVQASSPFFVNGLRATSSYSIPSGSSAMSAGPITIASGVTVTVPSGSKWVVL